MIKTQKSRIEALTSLCFFAAIYVMVLRLEPYWLNFGPSAAGLWGSRFLLVYPVYLLSRLLGFMPAVMAIYRVEPNWHDGAKILGFYLLHITLLNGRYLPSGILNYPGWSSSTEAFFYLVFPCLETQIWGIHLKTFVLFILLVAALSILIPRLAFVVIPDLRVLQDAVAGRHFLLRPKTENQGYGWIVGLALAVYLVIVIFFRYIQASFLRNGFLGLPFVAIIYFTANDKKNWSRILNFSPLILLGELSYAIYIFYLPFRDLALELIRRSALAAAIPGPILFFFFVTGIILVSILVTLKIEEPCRQWLKPELKTQPKMTYPILVETGAV